MVLPSNDLTLFLKKNWIVGSKHTNQIKCQMSLEHPNSEFSIRFCI